MTNTPVFQNQVDGFEVSEDDTGGSVRILGCIPAEHEKENMLSCAPKLNQSAIEKEYRLYKGSIISEMGERVVSQAKP